MTEPGRAFMRHTFHSADEQTAQEQGVPQPPLAVEPPPGLPLIDLPAPASAGLPPVDLRALIEERRTYRRYADSPLTLAELSLLLWTSQGVKEVTSRPLTLRTVPSAGGRHPFETLVLANRVEGLEPGLYRYFAIQHKLGIENPDPGLAARIQSACLDQNQITGSAVTLFWIAVVLRTTWRYGTRGYRYINLDAGHVCQNVYLVAEALGCGVCAIGAYDDEALNALLGVDGEEEFVAYGATVGRKP